MRSTLLLILITTISCSNFEESNQINTKQSIREIFTEREIEGLSRIVDFTDKQICEIRGKSKLSGDCYKEFFHRLLVESNGDVGEYQATLNFEEQREFISKLDKYVFNLVWSKKENQQQVRVPIGNEIKDSTYTIDAYYVNFNGRIREYFETIKKIDVNVERYLDHSKILGDYSGMFFHAEIISNWDHINFDNVEIRLLLATFLIQYNNYNSQLLGKDDLINIEIRKKFEERRKNNPS